MNSSKNNQNPSIGGRPISLMSAAQACLLASMFLPPTDAGAQVVGRPFRQTLGAEALTAQAASVPLTSAEKTSVLALINAKRAVRRTCGTASYGPVPALTWSTRLESAAQRHSNDMATRNFFSHTGSDGSTPATRITAAGYTWSFIGENIAAGQPTISAVVDAWLASPGHCVNLMSSRAKHLGMAKATNAASRYRIYWTLDLAAPL